MKNEYQDVYEQVDSESKFIEEDYHPHWVAGASFKKKEPVQLEFDWEQNESD